MYKKWPIELSATRTHSPSQFQIFKLMPSDFEDFFFLNMQIYLSNWFMFCRPTHSFICNIQIHNSGNRMWFDLLYANFLLKIVIRKHTSSIFSLRNRRKKHTRDNYVFLASMTMAMNVSNFSANKVSAHTYISFIKIEFNRWWSLTIGLLYIYSYAPVYANIIDVNSNNRQECRTEQHLDKLHTKRVWTWQISIPQQFIVYESLFVQFDIFACSSRRSYASAYLWLIPLYVDICESYRKQEQYYIAFVFVRFSRHQLIWPRSTRSHQTTNKHLFPRSSPIYLNESEDLLQFHS